MFQYLPSLRNLLFYALLSSLILMPTKKMNPWNLGPVVPNISYFTKYGKPAVILPFKGARKEHIDFIVRRMSDLTKKIWYECKMKRKHAEVLNFFCLQRSYSFHLTCGDFCLPSINSPIKFKLFPTVQPKRVP